MSSFPHMRNRVVIDGITQRLQLLPIIGATGVSPVCHALPKPRARNDDKRTAPITIPSLRAKRSNPDFTVLRAKPAVNIRGSACSKGRPNRDSDLQSVPISSRGTQP